MGEKPANCRITVDTYRCNSCESCVVLCPELFRINEASGKAEAVNDLAPCSEELHRAAAICAEKCIEVEAVESSGTAASTSP